MEHDTLFSPCPCDCVSGPIDRASRGVRRLVIKLRGAGKLQSRYSVHDLRHAFAVRLYEATHDVYKVEKALVHATRAVTETYLRSLELEQRAVGFPELSTRPAT